jgi:hypothetical protein
MPGQSYISMLNKIAIAGIILISFLLWMGRTSVKHPETGLETVENALNSVRKPFRTPTPIMLSNDLEYLSAKDEIIRAYVEQKRQETWSNNWTRGETPPWDTETFNALLKYSNNGYKPEVRALFFRVMINTNFPNKDRAQAMNIYTILNNGKLEDEFMPLFISFKFGSSRGAEELGVATMLTPYILPTQWSRFTAYLESLPADNYNKKAIAEFIAQVKANQARMNEKPSNP